MANMSTLSVAVSGLTAAQAGLYVTGHNVSNVNTIGYTRQRADQQTGTYRNIGFSGNSLLQVGLGTDISQIQQIRDMFLDKNYRDQASHMNYYSVRYEAINEIENILGEMQGYSKMSTAMDNMWKSLQELSTHPDGLETRSLFVNSCIKFTEKVNDVAKNLEAYQNTLNGEVKTIVQRLNQIGTQINDLSGKIQVAESSGDHANDYRDQRNLLLDELSTYCNINYYETKSGGVNVAIEGNDFLYNGSMNTIGLKYTTPGSGFVVPVFTSSKTILPADSIDDYVNGKPPTTAYLFPGIYPNLNTNPPTPARHVAPAFQNDNGKLKSLLITRGQFVANYSSSELEIGNSIIPKAQREFDLLVNSVVTMINDALAPKDANSANPAYPVPSDLYGVTGTELFCRGNSAPGAVRTPRYDENGVFIEEDPDDINTLYRAGNIYINPSIITNYSELCLNRTGDRSDNSLVEEMLSKWKNTTYTDYYGEVKENEYGVGFNSASTKLTFDNYYSLFVTGIGQIGQEAITLIEAENVLLTKLSNDRTSLSGVSMDEEMANMMRFQHAYNAAAKLVNEVDSMLDRVINRTGRSGL